MKNLFSGMSQTTQSVAPFLLLSSLRSLAPQFAEQDRSGGFAQQGKSATLGISDFIDADEVWTQIISALRSAIPEGTGGSFVDRYMSVHVTKTYVQV